MSVLRNLESKLAGLVEGTFSRAFKSEVRPVEIARKLAREMEQHKVASLSRTYAPNEYVVWLSPQGSRAVRGLRGRAAARAVGLPARARPPRADRPAHAALDQLRDRRRPAPGRVRHPGAAGARRRGGRGGAAEPGRPRPHDGLLDLRPPLGAAARARPAPPRRARARRRADLRAWARAAPCWAARARRTSRSTTQNVSRKHAELRPSGASWTVRDLGSTNGVKVNGRRIQGAQSLRSGDTITLGTSDIVFELE